MLAAHRDQENLVHSHQVPVKQQPRTPGSRYPKTPLGRFAKNDENAATSFTGKVAAVGAVKNTGNGKLATRPAAQRPVLATPLGNQSRAPLGNKTTNAKARPAQSAIVKDRVKQNETSQVRPSGTQRLKQRQAEPTAPTFEIQHDKEDIVADEEPEYAPPAPTPLPYHSDVLPAGGLTFEGLKKKYILSGYYEHFYNPVDEIGVSRLDRAFNDEMKFALDKAIAQNDREFEALDWSVADVPETKAIFRNETILRDTRSKRDICKNKIAASSGRTIQTTSSRRAASALAIHSDRAERPVSSRAPSSKRPIAASSQLKPAKSSLPERSCLGATPGEAASRTTIGYNKGRTASSMMHPRQQASKNPTIQAPQLPLDNSYDLTITPARARQVSGEECLATSTERPQFTSIFYDEESDAEPLTLGGALVDFDDDETFELKLDM